MQEQGLPAQSSIKRKREGKKKKPAPQARWTLAHQDMQSSLHAKYATLYSGKDQIPRLRLPPVHFPISPKSGRDIIASSLDLFSLSSRLYTVGIYILSPPFSPVSSQTVATPLLLLYSRPLVAADIPSLFWSYPTFLPPTPTIRLNGSHYQLHGRCRPWAWHSQLLYSKASLPTTSQ